MSKIPKEILEKIIKGELLEKFDKESNKWVPVEIDHDDPDVVKLKEFMLAEVEIMVIKEALEMNIVIDLERDMN